MRTFLPISIVMILTLFVFVKTSIAQGVDVESNIGTEIVMTTGIFNPQLGVYIITIVELSMIFGAIACLFFLLWGGIEWTTSGGDQQKYESARNKMTAAAMGLGILSMTFLLWLMLLFITGLNRSSIFQVPGFRSDLTTSGGGSSSSGTSSGTSGGGLDCSPFPSCEAWQQAFNAEHGYTPGFNGWEYNALRWSNENVVPEGRGANAEDWLEYYCQNNHDPNACPGQR